MNLPELSWQILYGRLAWAIVLPALACALWPHGWSMARGKAAGILAGIAAVVLLLPGASSPVHWLALAFQWPSALLAGLCIVCLHGSWHNQRPAAMTVALAMVITCAGVVLYCDAFGVSAMGLYYWGFSPYAAPAMALLLAGGAVAAVLYDRARPQALALLLAAVLFAVPRLPSGNLWDALLDPLLWAWALIFLARRSWQRVGRLAAYKTRME